MDSNEYQKIDNDVVWQDTTHFWFGASWPFKSYRLTHDRLFLKKGIFTVREYEVRLYRIQNIRFRQSFIQKAFGLGTIHIDSADKDLGCFDIINIRDSLNVKEMLSKMVEIERERKGVVSREYIMNSDNHGF